MGSADGLAALLVTAASLGVFHTFIGFAWSRARILEGCGTTVTGLGMACCGASIEWLGV